jgi:hypothetical protein
MADRRRDPVRSSQTAAMVIAWSFACIAVLLALWVLIELLRWML